MAKDLADLVVTLELQSAKYQAGFDAATKKLNQFHKDTSDSLKGIADLFATYLSADAIVEFATKTLDASASLANFSKSAGVSVEALSALQFAAQAGGVGTDQLNESLKKLNVSISDAAGNADSKAATAFNLLGINVRNANGSLKDATTVFDEVANKFQSTQDGANKVALAVAIFGKAGEELIPTLDKGAAGLKNLADQAAAAGAIIDGPTAQAAEDFKEKLDLLKTTLVSGIGAQVEKNLLPVLTELADQFLNTAKNADSMRVVVDEVTAGFKLLISGGLVVKEIFGEIGDAIGGAVAAIGAVLKGNFKQASQILDDQSAQAKKSAEGTANALLDTWQSTAPKFVGAVQDTVDKTKAVLGSLAGAEAFNAAIKTLTAFTTELQGEASKLDQGTIAATKYKLAHGDLAKALAITGEAGKKLATDAVAAATQIETTEIQKQLLGLQAQLKTLSGDTAGAALDAFGKSVETLEHQLKDVGGATQANGQAIIDNLKQATAYQQTFNTLQTASSRINQDAAEAAQKVTDAQANGAISDLEAERQLQAIRDNTITQLQGIKNGEDSIAAAANQPALTQGAKAFSASLDNLKSHADALTTSIRTGLEDATGNEFADFITGAKSFGDAIKGLLLDIDKQFADLIAKQYAQKLFTGSGAGAGIPGFLSSLFGGASSSASPVIDGVIQNGGRGGGIGNLVEGFADGGTISPGQVAMVGEDGPELAVGGKGGTNITPNSELGGVKVTNNFVIQAPNGQISRPSQMQTAAAVSRSVQQANRRNN